MPDGRTRDGVEIEGRARGGSARLHRRLVRSGSTKFISASFRVVAAVGLVASVAVAALPGAAPPAGAATVGPPWTVSTSYPVPVSSLAAISCPSTSACVAVGYGGSTPAGGVVLTTTDGGTTWTQQTIPSGVGAFYGVACPSTSDCVAVGRTPSYNGVVLTTTDGGTTWTQQTIPSGIGVGGVSCPSTTNCVVVGDTTTYNGVVLTTADGGTTWVNQSLPSGVGSLNSVSCASTSDCIASGNTASSTGFIITSADGGVNWSAQTVPSGVGSLGAVSCPSTSVCVMTGSSSSGSGGVILGTTDGGTTWASEGLPIVVYPSGVSCATTSDCVAVGANSGGTGAILTTTDGGTTWVSQSVPGATGLLTGVSCPSTADCTTVGGGLILTTTDGGTTWVNRSLPSGVYQLNGVSCPSTTECVSVGNRDSTSSGGVILTTADGGAKWGSQAVPAAADELDGVACPSATFCVAVGGAYDTTTFRDVGVILTTTDGGSTWTNETVPSGVGMLSGVFCASTSDCMTSGRGSSGGAILTTTDGGTTWANQTIPSAVSNLDGVSCSSTNDCIAVGGVLDTTTYQDLGVILTTTDGGMTWTSQAVPNGVAMILAVSCLSSSPCIAVGSSSTGTGVALGSGDGGTTWTSLTFPSATGMLSSVSCPSQTDCAAVGTSSIVTSTDGGATWASQSVPSGVSELNGVSCTNSSACIAAGSGTGSVGGIILSGGITVAPGTYTPLAPTRICDTRAGNPSGLSGPAAQCNGVSGAGDPLVANTPYPITVAGQFSVPLDATAVVVNVTVVGPKNAGYLTVYPAGGSIPTASNVNFTTGAVVPNLVQVGLGTNGQLDLVANVATDVVVDLEGYVAPTSPNGTGSGLYDPLSTPARICDTRAGNPSNLTGTATQCDAKTLVANTPMSVQVAGIGGVPATGVEAVVVNVTVVNPTNSGYLTLYPASTGTPPTASNVNFTTSEVVPNRVIVPVSASGALDMVANTATDAIVDVSGWYSTSGGSGTSFTPLASPVRICDTRSGNPSNLSGPEAQCNGTSNGGDPLGATATHTITVTGLAGVPTDAKAVVLNVTAVTPTAATYLTVFPSGTPPTVSDLNPTPGDVEANLVVATVSPTGTIDIYNNAGTANVVVDVAGWYS